MVQARGSQQIRRRSLLKRACYSVLQEKGLARLTAGGGHTGRPQVRQKEGGENLGESWTWVICKLPGGSGVGLCLVPALW